MGVGGNYHVNFQIAVVRWLRGSIPHPLPGRWIGDVSCVEEPQPFCQFSQNVPERGGMPVSISMLVPLATGGHNLP